MRALRLWLYWARLSLGREALFRGNLLLRWLAHGLWLGTAWLFFEALYAHVPTLAGWRREHVWLLLAVNEGSQQLFNMFVGRSLAELPERIWEGQLDSVLTKPVSPLFILSIRRMQLHDAPALGLPLVLGWIAWRALDISLTPERMFGFGLLILLGMVARYAVTLAAVSIGFWVSQLYALPALMAVLFRLASYPESIFRGASRAIFTFVIPVLVVANFPVQSLLTASFYELLLRGLIAAGFWLFLAAQLWRAGLRRYTAVGG
ncbi:MAG: hypothetical protein GXO36_06095 [Chloroflexi bacterium]|nr:hypothetical protein [Chloroflexota bacterium]